MESRACELTVLRVHVDTTVVAMIPPDRTIPVRGRAQSGLDRDQSSLNWSEQDYDTIFGSTGPV